MGWKSPFGHRASKHVIHTAEGVVCGVCERPVEYVRQTNQTPHWRHKRRKEQRNDLARALSRNHRRR